MEAPKCQFCGKREWRHICASNSVVNVVATAVPCVVNAVVNGDRHKKTEKRSEYMREYMKVVRAVKAGRAFLIKGA